MSRQLLLTTAILILVAAGMLTYLFELRKRETSQLKTEAAQHVAPPASGPFDQITVWIAYDSTATLKTQSIAIPSSASRQERAEAVLRRLVEIYTSNGSPHPLQAGSEVHNVFLVEPGLAVIDVNSAFVAGQTSGILAEELTLASMIQSLAANVSGLTRIKILVDGKEQETLAGHADISGIYDTAEIADLARQLQQN